MRRCKLLSAGRTCISTASIFSAGARQIRLCQLKLRRLERFTYEYDFGDGWLHDIRLEAVLATDARKTYPTCVAGRRAAPSKDCGGPDAFMEDRWKYSAIGSRMSRDDVDELVDELDGEDWEIQRRCNPDRFDRRRVNRALAHLAAGSCEGAVHEIHHSTSD